MFYIRFTSLIPPFSPRKEEFPYIIFLFFFGILHPLELISSQMKDFTSITNSLFAPQETSKPLLKSASGRILFQNLSLSLSLSHVFCVFCFGLYFYFIYNFILLFLPLHSFVQHVRTCVTYPFTDSSQD